MVKADLKPVYREYLVRHADGRNNIESTELSMVYTTPEDSELFKEYLKAVDYLTIDQAKKLERKVQSLGNDINEALLFNLKFLHTVRENSTLDQNSTYIEKFLEDNPQYRTTFDKLMKSQNREDS